MPGACPLILPQEPVHLARVRAWLARRRRRLLLLVHEFVLIKFIDVHPTEARGQRVPGHGGDSAPAEPAMLRSRPPLYSAQNRLRLGGGKRPPGTSSTSSARSRCRPPTSGSRRNRKFCNLHGISVYPSEKRAANPPQAQHIDATAALFGFPPAPEEPLARAGIVADSGCHLCPD
ncbi:TPA: hypothetical protein BOS_12057 [Bos taurus]|nr:TPA: hypothetical protein BOS_12057 [Bos taurus]